MKLRLIPFTWAASATLATAEGTDGHTSPNGKYFYEYHEALPHESNVRFLNTKTGKQIGLGFSYGYEPESFLETKWSHDSSYLAVIVRGTRTTAHLVVYHFEGDMVTMVDLPDFQLNLLGRRNLIEGGRYQWCKNLRWEDTTLTFHYTGQWKDGPGDPKIDPDNWFYFDVSIRFGGKGSKANAKLASVSKTSPLKNGVEGP